ncbi:putative 3-phenylpropionic acid transporter [Methylobacterium bullatum]|uniref:Putative 3-phenylpropionic acid transporter n=1 Tax=Methylobacterium bullatum TaxID=570505 RepID=A0A679IUK4_9HYPH|nr:putative 3-phenylpropionic acid transporter [Methylobacterium bullatum]
MSDRTDDRRLLAGHLALFVALYAGYGALSPFLPLFLERRGLPAHEIAWLLALAILLRMGAGPLAGWIADRWGIVRPVLAGAAVLAGLSAFGHLAATGFAALLVVGLAYAVLTAPLAPFSDALALAAPRNARRFVYGWVRGAGSAAFILATSLVGWLVPGFGIEAAILIGGGLFVAAGLAATGLGTVRPPEVAARPMPPRGFSEVLANRRFRRVVLAASLVMGAHAMHDAFAMILWSRNSIPAGIAGLLWSEAVAAEILVFLLAGPWILRRLDPGRAIGLAAVAGALRWGIGAETVALPALVAIQCLHGLTFALLHLACLKEIGRCVPPDLTATALTLYGPLGLGLSSALFTLAAGPLFAAYGASGFWAMSAVSLTALPVAVLLARGDRSRSGERVHR